jgi:hypothetical protein
MRRPWGFSFNDVAVDEKTDNPGVLLAINCVKRRIHGEDVPPMTITTKTNPETKEQKECRLTREDADADFARMHAAYERNSER